MAAPRATPLTAADVPRIARILLATDGSSPAARATAIAAAVARASGAVVDVLSAWEVPAVTFAGSWVGSAVAAAAAEERASQRARLTAAEVECLHVETVTWRIAEGRAAARIVEHAGDLRADLVVMGSRGLGPVRRLVLGSTSEEVVRTSARPVLLARGPSDAWPPQRIVAAHDGTASAHRAARLGATLARVLDMPLCVAGVVEAAERTASSPVAASPVDMSDILESAAARIAGVCGRRPAVLVATGDPANELLELTLELPTLLVLGRGGDCHRAQDGRVGRVATKIVHAAPGPVLVVPSARDGAR